jgi:hypothetical protein
MSSGDFLQLLVALIGAVLGTSGFVMVWLKGRTERERLETESRERRETAQVEADEARETAMATAVVALASDSNKAIIGLTEKLVTGTNASLTQLATNIEGIRTDAGHQGRYAREVIEQNTDAFALVTEELEGVNRRLDVVVQHLARGHNGVDPVQ